MNQYQYTKEILRKNQEEITKAKELLGDREDLKELVMSDIGLTEDEADDAIEESDLLDDMLDRNEHDNHVTDNQI